jgi:hypothetical protein
MVLGQAQRLVGRTLLNAGDVKEEMVRRRLMNGNSPNLVERIDPLVSVLYHERVLYGKGNLLIFATQIQHFAKFDFAEILCLIPKVDLLSVKVALHPGKEQRMLMGVIRRIIASEFLARRRIDWMDVTAAAEVLWKPFGNRLWFLDVLQDWFSPQGDANRVICLCQIQIIAKCRLSGDTERIEQHQQCYLVSLHLSSKLQKLGTV